VSGGDEKRLTGLKDRTSGLDHRTPKRCGQTMSFLRRNSARCPPAHLEDPFRTIQRDLTQTNQTQHNEAEDAFNPGKRTNQESPTNQTGPFQTKAMMHRWRRSTGAEVEHSRRRDLFKRMPS
jgi:hypothetical protein